MIRSFTEAEAAAGAAEAARGTTLRRHLASVLHCNGFCAILKCTLLCDFCLRLLSVARGRTVPDLAPTQTPVLNNAAKILGQKVEPSNAHDGGTRLETSNPFALARFRTCKTSTVKVNLLMLLYTKLH